MKRLFLLLVLLTAPLRAFEQVTPTESVTKNLTLAGSSGPAVGKAVLSFASDQGGSATLSIKVSLTGTPPSYWTDYITATLGPVTSQTNHLNGEVTQSVGNIIFNTDYSFVIRVYEVNNYGITTGEITQTFTVRAFAQGVDIQQNVTVTPVTTDAYKGEPLTLIAAGGHNGYNWTAVDGGGLTYDGDTAIFFPNKVGVWVVQVMSPAGAGYAASTYATSTITVTLAPPESFKANITFDNRSRTKTAYFTVWQHGAAVDHETVPAGEVHIRQVTLTDGSNYTVTFAETKEATGLIEDGVYTVSEETEVLTDKPTDVSRGAQAAAATADTSPTTSSGAPRNLGTIYIDVDKKKAPTEGDTPEADKFGPASSALKAKLPTAPSISGPGTTSGVYSFSMQIPGVDRVYDFSFDLTDYRTSILIYRSLVKAAMTVGFFFLTLRAVKEAAA